MRRVIHVPNVQLELSPLISLSPETVLNKVIIPLTVFTMVPHLSLRWLALSLVGMVHFCWLFSFRKGILKNVWQSVKWVLTSRSVMNKIRKHTDIVVGFHPRVFQGIVSTKEREYTIYGFRQSKDTHTSVRGQERDDFLRSRIYVQKKRSCHRYTSS